MPVKPRLQCISVNRPLALDNNASLLKKADNINWADKTELTDYIDLLYVSPNSDTYLYVKCDCGIDYIYTEKSDVPSDDVTCSCGRNVIKYGA